MVTASSYYNHFSLSSVYLGSFNKRDVWIIFVHLITNFLFNLRNIEKLLYGYDFKSKYFFSSKYFTNKGKSDSVSLSFSLSFSLSLSYLPHSLISVYLSNYVFIYLSTDNSVKSTQLETKDLMENGIYSIIHNCFVYIYLFSFSLIIN